MKSRQLFGTGLVSWGIIALAIILLYLSYFFIYIPNQETKLRQRSFRIIKEYGSNMHDKYQYYKKHTENYSIFYLIKSTLTKGTDEERKNNIRKFKSDFPDIYKVIVSLQEGIETELSGYEDQLQHYEFDTTKNQYVVNYYLDENTIFDFFYEAYMRNEQIKKFIQKDSLFNENVISNYDWYGVVQKVPFDKLMEGLKFDRLLDNILLFDSSSVMYNSNLEVVYDITEPGVLIDSTSHWNKQGGVFETIEVRGEKKHVMILPVKFLGKQMFLAGLINDRDFRKKTRAINNQLLIIISGLILLLFISIPILKVLVINKEEQLHARDATATTVSLLLGVGLLILILISALRHFIVDPQVLKSRVNKVSDSLYFNFQSDLTSVFDLYSSIVNPSDTTKSDLSAFAREEFTKRESLMEIPSEYLEGQIPINEILLIDSAGGVAKAVTKTAFSDLVQIDLSERLYFKNAMDISKSWYIKERDDWFYIESIKSYNTGKQEAAISFHLQDSVVKLFQAPVLAITSEIPSLYRQVLPIENQFMIINQEGHVLFHSVKSKNLHENFVEECNQQSQLAGAIKHRVAETLEVTYNEKNWLIRIIPVEDTPLYHITLLDLNQIRNKNARVFLYTFYFLIFSIICIFIGVFILQKKYSKRSFIQSKSWSLKWLLFDTQKYAHYKTLLIIQIVLLTMQVIGLFFNLKHITMLVYQIIWVCFSGFIVLVILGGNQKPLRHIFKISNVVESFNLNVFFSENNVTQSGEINKSLPIGEPSTDVNSPTWPSPITS